ncbi:hypothetical protein BDR06DRAFT_955869 [Suillus hirtellus]|nr:hypothetical protein BDR06DRAFT_955869 [Suillus hirtellus]
MCMSQGKTPQDSTRSYHYVHVVVTLAENEILRLLTPIQTGSSVYLESIHLLCATRRNAEGDSSGKEATIVAGSAAIREPIG